jgi:hypothetical protein
MTVPIAADHSTSMPIMKSHKPTSSAAGNEKNDTAATKLENAKGQMSRGLSRRATAAPINVTKATTALKGRIRKPVMSTLRSYSFEYPPSTIADIRIPLDL